MNKIIYFFTLLFTSSGLFAQDFAFYYTPLDTDEQVIIRDVVKTTTDELIVGFDLKSGATVYSGIMKTTNQGAIIWSKTLEIPASIAGCSFEVLENADGNFYLWGLSKQAETNYMRAILSEISSDGNLLWSKEYNFGFNVSPAYSINKLEILPSGDLQMMIAVYDEVIVMKTNRYGDIIWGKSTSSDLPEEEGGGKNPGFEWLGIPGDGGLCASKAISDFSLLRYSDDGDLLWTKTYNLGGYTHGKSIARSPNGNILVSGYIFGTAHIMEISDEDGSINWIKILDGYNMTYGSKSHLTIVDDMVILDFTTTSAQQFIIKLDANGTVFKTMKHKHIIPINDYNKIEVVSSDENYYYGSGVREGIYTGMIQKVENLFEESCMIEEATTHTATIIYAYSDVPFTPEESDFTNEADIAISLTDVSIRVDYACEQQLSIGTDKINSLSIYPNPSTNTINITVSENLVNANYSITDLSGKQILTNKVYANQMQIDLSELSNGQYIFAIQTEKELVTEKITIIQ